MDFDLWVDDVGGVDAAAKRLGVKARTVKSWLDGTRSPSSTAANNIIKKSAGRVDYNGIYNSTIKARKARGIQC